MARNILRMFSAHRSCPLSWIKGPPVVVVDVQELHLVELGDAVDQTGDLAAEATLQLGHGHVAVFGDVVAQGGDDRRGIHAQAGQRFGYRERVVDVRLARLAKLRSVRLGRETRRHAESLRRLASADICRRRRRAPAGCAGAVGVGAIATTVVTKSTTERVTFVFPV